MKSVGWASALCYDAPQPHPLPQGSFLTAKDEADLEAKCLQFLESRGVFVELPRDWEKPLEFCERLDVSRRTLSRCLDSKWKPAIQVERSPKGRLLRLRSNAQFDRYASARRAKNRPEKCEIKPG